MPLLCVSELIRPDLIAHALIATTKDEVLLELVSLLHHKGLICDQGEMLRALQKRESSSSTSLPEGCAMPHPAECVPGRFRSNVVVLGRTLMPISFGLPDNVPVDLFFLLCCQDRDSQVEVMHKLLKLIKKTNLLSCLRQASDAAAMHQCFRTCEAQLTNRQPTPERQL